MKLITKELRRHYKDKQYEERSNYFWVIDNTQGTLDLVERINGIRGAKDIGTFDFSTLYTTIHHDELKATMRKVIKRGFDAALAANKIKGRGDACISVFDNKKDAQWGESRSKAATGLTYEGLIARIELLIDNIWVAFGDSYYRQRIGILIGT